MRNSARFARGNFRYCSNPQYIFFSAATRIHSSIALPYKPAPMATDQAVGRIHGAKFIHKLSLRSESPERGSTHASDLDGKDYAKKGCVGVVAAVTSTCYLIRCAAEWVPVMFRNLCDEHGAPVSLSFPELKNRPVLVRKQGATAKAFLNTPDDCLPTMRPTPPPATHSTAEGGLLTLAKDLCEQVAALSLASSSNPSSIPLILARARRTLSDDLPPLIEQLESDGCKTAQKLRLFVRNADGDLTRWKCGGCAKAKAAFVFSCGHYCCAFCARQKKCGQCKRALSKVEERIVAGVVVG